MYLLLDMFSQFEEQKNLTLTKDEKIITIYVRVKIIQTFHCFSGSLKHEGETQKSLLNGDYSFL